MMNILNMLFMLSCLLTLLMQDGKAQQPNGGAATTAATDAFLRRAFVATYNLRNRVTRQP
jgi:hypothetical protein